METWKNQIQLKGKVNSIDPSTSLMGEFQPFISFLCIIFCFFLKKLLKIE